MTAKEHFSCLKGFEMVNTTQKTGKAPADANRDAGQQVFIVTQTFPPRIGGMENVMYALSLNLAHSGFEVTVLPNHKYINRGKGTDLFKVINFPQVKPLRIIAKKVVLSLKLTNKDIVICDSWKSVNAVSKRFKGRLVVLAHGQEYLKGKRHGKRIENALNRASLIVASSHFTADLVKDGFDIASDKIEVIPPTYMLEETPQRQVAENKTNADLQLISICRLDKRKGLGEAIEAIAGAKEIKHNWRWDIIGNGEEAGSLKDRVSELQLENKIQFWHNVQDAEKIEMLQQADLFIMPSYKMANSVEGFGISYVEAAQYGVPAIAGNSGGSVDAVIDGETGWCVDAKSTGQLQKALTEAINSPEERKNRGNAAYNRFIDAFCGTKVSEVFIANMLKDGK